MSRDTNRTGSVKRGGEPDQRSFEGVSMHKNHYGHLAIMTLFSFVAMFILMYSMVDRVANVYPNLNQFFMAATMAAPMVIIELLIMRSMYPSMKTNLIYGGISLVALIGFFVAIRAQTAVGDVQFIKSMIPHHAGAILMCDRAPIANVELKMLCGEIVQGQRREIEQMKQILAQLPK